MATSSPGKKRLSLYLRYVNSHIYRDKIKFDDWKCFENYISDHKGYMCKFDLKNGYHHIDINSQHHNLLGFSWIINGEIKYFVFAVLPFGLSLAPFIFKKW